MTATEEKSWDVVSLLKTSSDFFKQKGIVYARLNAELLLAHVLKMKRLDLYLAFDRPILDRELIEFREIFRRRLSHEPLQYILGEQEFFGLKFKVDHRVLIPRPETELLVESVIESFTNTSAKILDIGTGSGCIAISLAKMLSDSNLVAVDISKDATILASQNAELNGVTAKIRFEEQDSLSLDFASRLIERDQELFDAVVSNPPYIPIVEEHELEEEVKSFEPHLALFVESGFEFYEKITTDSKSLLKPGGKIFFELHADAASRVEIILKENNFTDIQFRKDYSGFTRIVIATKS